MEIHHGGYFEERLDGSKTYKVPRWNKIGGVTYLDGSDLDKISWVEMHNIAYDLGYRSKLIAFHFKVPKNPRFIHIKGDREAVDMVNTLPKKKRQIVVYITCGGRRRYEKALKDFEKPAPSGWSNPLINLTLLERTKVVFDANLSSTQLYGMKDDTKASKGVDVVENVIPLSQILISDNDEDNETNGDNEGAFGSLSNIVSDFDICKDGDVREEKSSGRRVNHTTRRPSGDLGNAREKERDTTANKEREELDGLARVEAELKESQASVGLSREKNDIRMKQAEEKKKNEAREKSKIQAADKREMKKTRKRAADAFKVREKVVVCKTYVDKGKKKQPKQGKWQQCGDLRKIQSDWHDALHKGGDSENTDKHIFEQEYEEMGYEVIAPTI